MNHLVPVAVFTLEGCQQFRGLDSRGSTVYEQVRNAVSLSCTTLLFYLHCNSQTGYVPNVELKQVKFTNSIQEAKYVRLEAEHSSTAYPRGSTIYLVVQCTIMQFFYKYDCKSDGA